MFAHFSILAVILFAAVIWERPIKYNKICDVYEGTPYFYRSPLMPWLLVFGYLAILSGYRSAMNDTTTYIYSFNNTEATWEALRRTFTEDIKYIGTDFIQTLFKMFISQNYHVWFLTWAVIESCLFINVLRREAVSFLDACFFFFASTTYLYYFSMMRQWMAVAILFWGSRYLRNNQMTKYFIVCIIAGVFHTSALVMIPIYFVVTGKPWKGKQIGFILLFSVSLVFLSPVLSALETVTEGSAYDYVVTTMRGNTGSSIVRAFIATVPVILSFSYRNQIDDPMINICVNMSLVDLMLNILASVTSGLYVVRLAAYVNVYDIILYPYLLNATSGKNKNLIKIAFYVLFMAFYFYQMTYSDLFRYRSDVLTWLSNY